MASGVVGVADADAIGEGLRFLAAGTVKRECRALGEGVDKPEAVRKLDDSQ